MAFRAEEQRPPLAISRVVLREDARPAVAIRTTATPEKLNVAILAAPLADQDTA